MRYSRVNSFINYTGVGICLILFFLGLGIEELRLLFGVLIRGSLGLLIVYNAVYTIYTGKPSVLIRKGQERHKKVYSIILLVVGLIALVTALMGYGFNGSALLDWRSVYQK